MSFAKISSLSLCLLFSLALNAQAKDDSDNDKLLEKAEMAPKKNYKHPSHANAQYLCEGVNVFVEYDDKNPTLKMSDQTFSIKISEKAEFESSLVGDNDVIYTGISDEKKLALFPLMEAQSYKLMRKFIKHVRKFYVLQRAWSFSFSSM